MADVVLPTSTALTLAEWHKRLDPKDNVAAIIELLRETNEILDDARFMQGNLPTGHRTTVRTDLPETTWRKLNYGVKPSKSKTKQVDDVCGMLEAYSQVDKSLADLNGNTAEFRLSEDRGFIQSMNQNMAQTLIYGDTAIYPDRFLGLAPRYPYKDSDNVIDALGTGSACTSIWIVAWGENTVHMTFPKGSKVGLQHTDKGQVTLTDDAGGLYEGYRGHYKWDAGFVVRDWRYVVRICNINTASMPANLPELLITGLNQLPDLNLGKPVIYCNKTVKTTLDIEALNKSNLHITNEKDPFGKPVTSFQGVPIRRVDAILDTEAALVAKP